MAAVAAALTARPSSRSRSRCMSEPAQVVHAGQTPRDDLRALGVRAAPGDELTLGFSRGAATARDGGAPRVGAVFRAASIVKYSPFIATCRYSVFVQSSPQSSPKRASNVSNLPPSAKASVSRSCTNHAFVRRARVPHNFSVSRFCAASAAAAPSSPAVAGGLQQARHGAVPDGPVRDDLLPRCVRQRLAQRLAQRARLGAGLDVPQRHHAPLGDTTTRSTTTSIGHAAAATRRTASSSSFFSSSDAGTGAPWWLA